MCTNCQQNNESFKKIMLLHSGLLFVAIPLGLQLEKSNEKKRNKNIRKINKSLEEGEKGIVKFKINKQFVEFYLE